MIDSKFFIINEEESDSDRVIVEVNGYPKDTFLECHFLTDGSTATTLRLVLNNDKIKVRDFEHYLGEWDDSFALSPTLEDEYLHISINSNSGKMTLSVKNQLEEGLIFDLFDDKGTLLQEFGYATQDDIVTGGL